MATNSSSTPSDEQKEKPKQGGRFIIAMIPVKKAAATITQEVTKSLSTYAGPTSVGGRLTINFLWHSDGPARWLLWNLR